MSDEMISISDGESHCRIVDPSSGTVQAPLKQIGLQGALVQTKLKLENHDALDLTVALKGLQPRQFFASVVSQDEQGLRLQWTPIDSGEQARLRSLLEAYRTLHKGPAPQASAPLAPQSPVLHDKSVTRRLIKPRSSTSESIVPFSEPMVSTPAPASPPAAAASSAASAAASSPSATNLASSKTSTSQVPKAEQEPSIEGPGNGERNRTRRLVRPSNKSLPRVQDVTPFSDITPEAIEEKPKAKAPGGSGTPSAGVPLLDDSGAHPETPDGDAASSEPDAAAGDPGKAGIIGTDGRMDIGASIRSRARTMKASELAARHDRVRVLNMGTIKQLIQEAVAEASTHLTRSLSEADRKRLLEEAEEGFKERLKAFELDKLSSEAKMSRLADQLRLAQETLEGERKRSIQADQFTVSAAGLDEIELKFKRLLDHSIGEGRVVPALEDELRKVIGTVFDQERQRIREQELKAQNDKITLLESKIKRLSGSLEDTERQRDEMQEWAKALEAQGGGAGLRNVFTPGLKDGDPNKKRKMALMKEILDENRAMRSVLGIATVQVDAATQEEIKKTEEAAKLTPEELAQIREQRKAPAPEPAAAKASDAEMRNVIAEATGGGALASDADEDVFEEAKNKVKVAAGAVRVTAAGTEELGEGSEVDPDDLPWQASAQDGADDDADVSVKRIKLDTNFKLPPLERK